MKRQWFLYGILVLLFVIAYNVNSIVLHFQVDPFIASTLAMGNCLEDFGNLGVSFDYLEKCSYHGGYWQAHARDYMEYEPFSGILIYIVSTLANIPLINACYLPVPYVTICLLLLSFVKAISSIYSKFMKRNWKLWNTYFSVSIFLSLLAFIILNCIGKFYLMEYHAINLVFQLLIFFIIFRMVQRNDKTFFRASPLLLTLIFASNLFTHYNFPLSLIGGIITLIILCGLFRIAKIPFSNKTIPSLVVILVIFFLLTTFQQYYFILIGNSQDITALLPDLVSQMLDRTFSSGSAGAVMASYHFDTVLLICKKLWHVTILFTIGITTIFTICYLKCTKIRDNPLLFILYLFVVGISLTWMLTYFSHYGTQFAFQIDNPWLIQIFLLLPIILFVNSDKTSWQKIGLFISLLAISSLIFLTAWMVFEADFVIGGHSHFPYQVKSDAESASDFLASHTEDPSLVCGSIESTSGLFERLNVYDVKTLEKVHPIPLIQLMNRGSRQHEPIQEVYNLLKQRRVSKFIITEYEINHGFYSGLTISPFNSYDTRILQSAMELNDNLIYNSKSGKIYSL